MPFIVSKEIVRRSKGSFFRASKLKSLEIYCHILLSSDPKRQSAMPATPQSSALRIRLK